MNLHTPLTLAALLALTACAPMAGPGMARFSPTDLPTAVQVPAGHSVAMETHAQGEITYQCTASKDMAGAPTWVFVGPDAQLMDRKGAQIGRYFGPPATWESSDGSKVTATQVAVAPGGTGNIPLQLVKANPAMGMGAMQGVTYIQRVATQGGVAPSAACTTGTIGQKQTVQYQADYIFWRAGMQSSTAHTLPGSA